MQSDGLAVQVDLGGFSCSHIADKKTSPGGEADVRSPAMHQGVAVVLEAPAAAEAKPE